jgi:hypothetical protein
MRTKIGFQGDVELLKKLEEAGANVEQEIIKAIQQSVRKPSEEMLSFMRKHKRRQAGGTLDSWEETITSKKGIINAEFGFSVRKGGLASIFWNYGTPRNAPSAHWFVSNAIEQNIDEIIEAQNIALRKAFKELV